MRPKTNPMRDLLREQLEIDDVRGQADDDLIVELRQDEPQPRPRAIRAS